jgi:23S rRNA pseudouridine2605 synthase
MPERIQKVLANLGYGSRREIEGWISAGRIKVNGDIAKLGDAISDDSVVYLDDKALKVKSTQLKTSRVLLYHKPIDEICTRHDPLGRPTPFDSLPELASGRWISIGRLDINSAGLLLFTNDGELANKLMHPTREIEIEREYLVRVFGNVTREILDNLTTGIVLEDGLAKFKTIKQIKKDAMNQCFTVVVTEGRNHLVRRLWQSQNLEVNRLVRIRFHSIRLPKSLFKGQFIELDAKHVAALKSL